MFNPMFLEVYELVTSSGDIADCSQLSDMLSEPKQKVVAFLNSCSFFYFESNWCIFHFKCLSPPQLFIQNDFWLLGKNSVCSQLL